MSGSVRGRAGIRIEGALIAAVGMALAISPVAAQTAVPAPSATPAPSASTVQLPTIDVVGTTPLSGTGVDVNKVPAAVTTIDSHQISQTKSANVVKALSANTPSVDVVDVSGNAFQPDVDFRGFDASPVSGTPQGLAIYQNGVRINEAFGDTRQLGPDPDRGGQIHRRHQQQSRLRAQRARRRAQRSDEGRLQLSGRPRST